MFRTRLLSGVVLMAIALVTIISGGYLLWATLFLVALIGLFELYRVTGVLGERKKSLAAMGAFGVLAYYLSLLFGLEAYGMMILIAALTGLMFVYVFSYPQYHAEQIMAAFFGIVYVAVMLSYIYLTRNLQDGAYLVWLIFICSWGCDTCAYCVGVLIGKHKMSPVLSPKKSIEGAVGGVIGAALIGMLYAVAVRKADAGAFSDTAVISFGILAAAGAMISMVGDLAASAIKRNHDIKDYGRLIPGHGGILDRFDSVIFTAPIVYYLCLVLM